MPQVRVLLAVGVILVGMALIAVGCGTAGGDCSGATPDGAGNCIPYDHGPTAAQQAAFRYFGARADQVACFHHGPFRHHGKTYDAWGCKAIRGGELQNDVLYCVVLRDGIAIRKSEASALPARARRCD